MNYTTVRCGGGGGGWQANLYPYKNGWGREGFSHAEERGVGQSFGIDLAQELEVEGGAISFPLP